MIRRATDADWPAIWDILEPVFRAGETYAVDRDITEASARAVWMELPAETYVWDDGGILGTYYIKQNHKGGASHVCNCGYVTAPAAQGRGIARRMCEHSQGAARTLGFTAMQFNLVLASNVGAVALWQKLGFDVVGTLPGAFRHPVQGPVDAHVMWKAL
ncbi:MAG: GNAT family N-acetyltransferase [Pseudomonadota bacterium]